MGKKHQPSPRNPQAKLLWDGSCRQRVVPSRKRKPKRAKDKLRRELSGDSYRDV